ncbi:efflux RND transporter periplasmic adaptor subunit [Arthrobacter woluwensis]|uniref:hypothetical protein n=1 Tax=Arthrobacter woluwensis TaxID=156980 RepID=UPI003811CBA3
MAGGILVVLLVASFLAGHFFHAPEWQTAGQQSASIEVWTTVEQKVVDSRVEFAGAVHQGDTMDLRVGSPVSANGAAILVRQTLRAGDRAEPGNVAAVISGKPYFLLSGPLPLYRDLAFRDSGDDVSALQMSLARLGHPVSSSGVMDWDTLAAVSEMFRQAGFAFTTAKGGVEGDPLRVVVPYRQFLVLPGTGGEVVYSAPVGTPVDGSKPLLTVRTSARYADFVADVVQIDSLRKGQAMTVRAGGKEYPGTITTIGAFQAGANGGRSGMPVRVDFSTGSGPLPGADVPATLLVQNASEKPELAVPLTAIRQDVQGSYVLKRSSEPATPATGKGTNSDPTPTLRVAVTVVHSGGGYAAIEGELRVGDSVRLT